MRRALAMAATVVLCGCGEPSPELALVIREPSDRRLFASIAALHLRAERDGRALAEQVYDPTTSNVRLDGVSYGSRTVLVLEGVTQAGDVVARGRTCPFEFTSPGGTGPRSVSLSIAPTNSFAPTVGPPLAPRSEPAVWTLGDGDVLVAGGEDEGAVVGAERYSVATARFTEELSAAPAIGRRGAEVTLVDSIGTVLSGGLARDGAAIATAELYRADTGSFVSIDNAAIGARAGHRAVTLPSDRVLLTGGAAQAGGTALSSTAIMRIQADGSATASVGPPLVSARRLHSAVVANGIPVLVGGYGSDGAPLATIEALVPSEASTRGDFAEIARLRTARAEATASLLRDGTILVVGGAKDAAGTPLLDAEVYNPITGLTTVYSLASARRGHSATALPDGRVLVIGGQGASGEPLASVELFVPEVGFVSERPLAMARAGHRAIPLCDGTVLVVGGAAGAEIYTPPP